MMTRRFVILRHEPGSAGPRDLHWDLLLELDGQLRTWALEREPTLATSIPASELAPHRALYLDYEGPVSQGRGVVSRFDRGTFTLHESSTDKLVIDLAGSVLQTRVTLVRTAADQRWIVSFGTA